MPRAAVRGEIKCGFGGCGLTPRFHAINLPALRVVKNSDGVVVRFDPIGPAHSFVYNSAGNR